MFSVYVTSLQKYFFKFQTSTQYILYIWQVARKDNVYQAGHLKKTTPKSNKNSSGDEIANVNFYAVRPEATQIRWNNAK